MSVKWKSFFIIVATLVIGILIGTFLAGPVLHRRVERRHRDRGPEMFTQMMERVIRPTAEQQEAVHAVLEKYSMRLEELHESFGTEMMSTIDSLKADLDPLLTEEQKARLKERHDRLERYKGRRPGPGMKDRMPPPPGPPPERGSEDPGEGPGGGPGDSQGSGPGD
jgi:hypothetical protein